jgi:hypothetical protein
VGLGTDVAGGAEPGLLPQAAFAVTASRMLRDGVDVRRDSSERGTTDTAIDTVTAFHLATAGGADVLGAQRTARMGPVGMHRGRSWTFGRRENHTRPAAMSRRALQPSAAGRA